MTGTIKILIFTLTLAVKIQPGRQAVVFHFSHYGHALVTLCI